MVRLCLLERHIAGHQTAFKVCYEVAIAAMRQGREMGRRVPKELSIIDFDYIDVVSMLALSVTTMRMDD